MTTNISNRVKNNIKLDPNSVWILSNRKPFNYSDGSEGYLKKVLSKAKDLSSNSYELEKWIKDWPSEYHLSRKRSQLLRGFDFDRSNKVLEVGCGCGAITRFLGETFDDVLAIEGSLSRASVARLRTSDMNNVDIICAPFQEIIFQEKFDIIFCIGVFEYSAIFVDTEYPHDHILNYFQEILKPDGVVVLAIENQFGLKYFSSNKEDHTGIMFDGLEGYPRYGDKKARTFGSGELRKLLKQYFRSIDFYFPYPDYKTPSCILSFRFFQKTHAGELIGRFRQNPYMEIGKSLYDERLVLLEIDKNEMLPFFSNSFLIVAGKKEVLSLKLKQLGFYYSNNRVEKFQTVTSFIENDEANLLVKKSLMNNQDVVKSKFIKLCKCQSKWIEGFSIHTQIMRRVKDKSVKLEELFAPCKRWLRSIRLVSSKLDEKLLIDGKYIDCVWSNSYILNGECKFVDLEWEWHESISINILLIRCLYLFLTDIFVMKDLNRALTWNSGKCLIIKISRSIGVELSKEDFKEFAKIEIRLSKSVYGRNFFRTYCSLIFFFNSNKVTYFFISSIGILLKKIMQKISAITISFFQ